MAVSWYHWQGSDLILRLRIQPRASRDEFAEPQGETLRVRITAPPMEGKANTHLRKFLAKVFQVPPSRVTLLSGETGRYKCLCIHTPRRLPPVIEPPSDTNTVA